MNKVMTSEEALAELQALFEFQKQRLGELHTKTEFTSAANSVAADVSALREILVDYIDLKNQVDAIQNLTKATEDLKRMGRDLSYGEGDYGSPALDPVEQLLGSLRKGYKT